MGLHFGLGMRNRDSRKRLRLQRVLRVQSLESRCVLSGLSIVDVQESHHDEYHHDDASGHLIHALPLPSKENVWTETATTGDTGSTIAAATSTTDVFQLHSNAGAAHTIYLDFDSHVTRGTVWNSSFTSNADIVTPAYNFSGDSSFDESESARIRAIWERVAEDFIPFNVNVTTQQPATEDLIKSGSTDSRWGVRVVIGGNGSWYGSAGGVAYVGSFNWNSDTPVYVFEDNLGNGNEKYTAEAISHEAGHALGLSHDGRTSPSEDYYGGSGSGATGWAPIMGVSYYKELTHWSRGEYTAASNREDDLTIITTRNGFGYRADDHGNQSASATTLTASGSTVSGAGIIETSADADVFTFFASSGSTQLNVLPAARGPNLDIAASLFNAAGTLIASANPLNVLSASISTTLTAGQYFLHVAGVGQGDPASTGYSDYASLGAYTISGSIVPSSANLIGISATAADLDEGNSGAKDFLFTVSRSGDLSGQASVNWSVAGSGTSPALASDFEGGVLPSGTITFAANESTRSIAVRVAGDLIAEANEGFEVILTGASDGNLLSTSRASGSIRNDDAPPAVPGITVSPVSGLTTSESGGSASFTVVLQSSPAANVVIPISSSNASEGTVNVTSLTFTSSNWNLPQTVRITGVDDTVRDGNVSYSILVGRATSSDASYNGIDAADVAVVNQDNDNGKTNVNRRGNKSKVSEDPIPASASAEVTQPLPVPEANPINSRPTPSRDLQPTGSSVDASKPVKKLTNIGSGDSSSSTARGNGSPRVTASENQRQVTSSPELNVNLLDQVLTTYE